MGAMLLFTLF